MFTVGPVHTRDYGPRYSVADTEPTARQFRGKGYYLYTLQEVSNWGGNTPCETPGGLQVEPKL